MDQGILAHESAPMEVDYDFFIPFQVFEPYSLERPIFEVDRAHCIVQKSNFDLSSRIEKLVVGMEFAFASNINGFLGTS